MTKRLQSWVAEIIGGTSAIGKPTEELFVANAAKVVLTGRSEDKCAALARRLGDQVLYCHTRLSGAAHDAARDRYCTLSMARPQVFSQDSGCKHTRNAPRLPAPECDEFAEYPGSEDQ